MDSSFWNWIIRNLFFCSRGVGPVVLRHVRYDEVSASGVKLVQECGCLVLIVSAIHQHFKKSDECMDVPIWVKLGEVHGFESGCIFICVLESWGRRGVLLGTRK
ncbi:hypothetical protein DSO57_1016214 [Entomophthora muscae]|uniref:Uncharacterized protein n=1 Tax=Entomophthora muscae TaxID=34485 RepID=A0ACC2UQK7_9FUNG|nr:hypothetical protein DSO57_1016214 [Entomophthora muscae]